jgi:hypothetical protein
VKTTIILVTDTSPSGMRQLVSMTLPAVPLPGEHIQWGGRTYCALERSWRFEAQEDGSLGMSAGLLVEQIAGPPHIVTTLGGTPN